MNTVIIKIKKENLPKIKTIKDLLPDTYNCNVSNFGFLITQKGQTSYISHQLGDTSIHRKKNEGKIDGFSTVSFSGHEWIIYLKNSKPGTKLHIDSIKPSCSSSSQKIYSFLIVE